MVLIFIDTLFCKELPNGLRYLRWGGDGEAVQPEKGSGVGNCLKMAHAAEGGSPQRQVHALLGNLAPTRTLAENQNHNQLEPILRRT
ncbi:hypothetical protein FBQ99_14725 [Chloroflexi bacterium CFX2]|nr:hypothetical protein [Chloroflexi bacterium CFX2]MDL1943585.1 hypothetical protein [Chloroflexi bacterium CFX2]